jgi:hypothetical protein
VVFPETYRRGGFQSLTPTSLSAHLQVLVPFVAIVFIMAGVEDRLLSVGGIGLEPTTSTMST